MLLYEQTATRRTKVSVYQIPFTAPKGMTVRTVAETFIAYMHGHNALDNIKVEGTQPRRLGPWQDAKDPTRWNLLADGSISIIMRNRDVVMDLVGNTSEYMRYSTMISLFKLTYPVSLKQPEHFEAEA